MREPEPVDAAAHEAGTAGNEVTDASMVSSTPVAAAMASAEVRSVPMKNRPSTESTTVPPAKRTAPPAVSIACTTACCGPSPPWSACR